MAGQFSNIGGAEPSTISFKLGTIAHDRGSTAEHSEIVVLGGQESSAAIAAVVNAAPASSVWALGVRQVGYVAPSTTVQVSSVAGTIVVSPVSTASVRVVQSSAGDLQVTVGNFVAPSTTVQVSSVGGTVVISPVSTASVRVVQSTATDLQVTVGNLSTTVNVSSLAGAVVVRSSAADHLATVYQSSAADLNVTVANLSTTVQVSSVAGAVTARVHTSSGGQVEGSTTVPAANAIGLHVRPVLPTRQSTSVLVNIGTAGGSTALLSSAAGVRVRVFAFSVMSTHAAISSCAFLSSNKSRWGLLVGSGSSGISGANLAVAPPGSIFETDAAEALNFSASSTGLYRVSIAYMVEP